MVYAVFAVLALIIFFAMYKSHRFFKSLIISSISGMCSLFAVNFIGSFIGIALPVNIFTSCVSCIGGSSGVIFLLLYDIIFLL